MTLAPSTLAAIAGFAGGLVLGFAARWGNFCSLGAIEDALYSGDTNRLRCWGLAIAIAIASTFALDLLGVVQITESIYLAQPANLIATLSGGLLFGLGMSLVGTCGHGTLARIGGGDLKSIVTFLVMGITAYATMSGLTAYLRVAIFESPASVENHTPLTGIAHLVAAGSGLPITLIACMAAATLIGVVVWQHELSRRTLITGVLVGLTISWGWFATGRLATDPFDPYPLTSYTFAAPLGESIIYVMTMTGATLKFGIGATAGVISGAAITSLWLGQFRWEACDDAREMRRQIAGGVLMGFGSVTALGCTIGQGLSAASTLALSAPVALLGIFCGAWLGLQWLIDGSFLQLLRRGNA